jgi:hypothetical protein
MEGYINLIIAILSGLVTAIPLVVQLVKYVKAAIQEKNWSKVLTLVLNLMTEAERMYATGTERKEFVMNSIESIKDTLNYQVDMNQISEIIDQIVASSKVINAKIEKSE